MVEKATCKRIHDNLNIFESIGSSHSLPFTRSSDPISWLPPYQEGPESEKTINVTKRSVMKSTETSRVFLSLDGISLTCCAN